MILCSTGAFFPMGYADPKAMVEIGRHLEPYGLEVLVSRSLIGHLDRTADVLVASGLRFPVVHAQKQMTAALPDPEAVEAFHETALFASRIGARVVVAHLWDLPESDADLPGRIEAAHVAADVLTDHGLELAVETIPCLHSTPLRNIAAILEHEPRAGVALDTEFLALHDELEQAVDAEWLWKAVRHVHVKDFSRGLVDASGRRTYFDPGTGTIDFPGFFRALEDRDYEGTVSLESPALMADSSPNLARLRRNLDRMSHGPWRFR